EPERALAVRRAVVRVHVPVRKRALERVRLDDPRRRLCVDLLLILDLDEAVLVATAGERRDEVLLGAVRGVGALRELELAERLLQLAADLVERRVRVGGDHRPNVLERETDRARLERRQPRRQPERVAPELLVDVDRAVGELGVDRVAAAAEVDEVQERQMLLELLRRNRREAREQLADRDVGVLVLAARGEEEREQRLEDGE